MNRTNTHSRFLAEFPRAHILLATAALIFVSIILLLIPTEEAMAVRNTLPLPINIETAAPITTEEAKAIASAPIPPKLQWQKITVKKGDSLSALFERAGVGVSLAHKVTTANKQTKQLARIYPGQELQFATNAQGELEKIRIQKTPFEIFEVSKSGNSFTANTINREPEIHTKYVEATINDSLFLTGQKAKLSNKLIMELANIFGWDIDFALDIRRGDHFSFIYEQKHLDGKKVSDGDIIAAEFTNNGRTYKAIQFIDNNGFANYYTPDGYSMRKAFLRSPVDFARISSRFNLRRKHPVLHKFRAHKGVDYAASRGTPIKASGDGKIIWSARKGGYGRVVIVQHGQKYSTLYAHMNGYARGIKKGKRVKQGQVIGYVGSSGLATGPHLHYEFRENGVHRNPLTVRFPNAKPIEKKYLSKFKQRSHGLLAQLGTYQQATQLAMNP